MTPDEPILPAWKWGTPEGSRELDRLLDRRLTFREKLEWLEEAETLALRLRGNRVISMETGMHQLGREKDLLDIQALHKLDPYR